MTAIDTTGTEIVPADTTMLLPVGTIDDGKIQMQRFQAECAAVLAPSDWQGRPGKKGSFVKKSGWRKLAMRYAISCRITGRGVERDADGNPVRAETTVLAIHKATGQEQEADGYCAVTELRFGKESGRYKVENDLRNTATTRAKNRAISDLIGYGQVDAENAGPADDVEEQPYGPASTQEEAAGLGRAIHGLWTDPATGEVKADVVPLLERLREDAGGYMPRIVARAVMFVAAHNPNDPRKRESDDSTARPGGAETEADGDGVPEQDVTATGEIDTPETAGEDYADTDAAQDDPPG